MNKIIFYVKSLFTDNNRFYPMMIGYFFGSFTVLIVTAAFLNFCT